MHKRCYLEQSSLHVAAKYRKIDIADFLISNGVSVDGSYNLTSPICSIIQCNEEYYQDMIEFLLDNGANFVASDDCDVNVLVWALYCQNPDAVESLLNFKPNLEFLKYHFHIYQHMFLHQKIEVSLVIAFIALRGLDILHFTDKMVHKDVEYIEWVKDYFADCKLEIERMKNRKICDTGYVSYLDFLTKPLFQVVAFSRNELLMNVLESLEYENEFPLYAFIFNKHIKRVNQLRSYIDLVEDFLYEYSEINLPTVLVHEILGHLSV